MNPIFCKYSNDRDPKFQIKTSIICDKSKNKTVCKSADNEEAIPHIMNLYKNYQKMSQSFAGTILCANKCELRDQKAYFEFLSGRTLENKLDELYFEGKYYEIIEQIKGYSDELYALKDNQDFAVTEEFKQVFGEVYLEGYYKSLAISNIDLIFGNIIDIDGKWHIIDYEWTFDFPVPISYILYRAIYYYVHGTTKRHELISLNIFKTLGITDEEKIKFELMEENFQRYVAGSKVTLSRLKQIMLKRKVPANIFEKDDYVQIYYNRANGFSEEDSYKKYYEQNELELIIPIMKDVKELRIDPSKYASLVELSYEINDICIICNENVREIRKNLYLFLEEDPKMYLNLEKKNLSEVCIKIKKIVLDKETINDICALLNQINATYKKQEELENEKNQIFQEKQKVDELLHVKEQRIAEIEAYLDNLNIEYNKYVQYVNSLHGKFAWRVLSAGKKTVKSVGKVGLINTCGKICKKVKGKLSSKRIEFAPVQQSSTAISHPKTGAERILIVVHEAQKAGATLLSLNIIRTIKKITNYEPVILLISGGPLTNEIKKEGITFELNQPDFSQIYDKENLKKIILQISQMGVKYAICNSVVTGIVLPALSSSHIKTVTMVHELPTSIITYNFVKAAENVAKYSDNIVFAADFVKRQFVEHFPAKNEICHIIPQGVYARFNTQKYEDKFKNKTALCKKLGISEDCKVVLGFGYGNFRKGLDWFGTIAGSVILADKSIHFAWLGDCDSEFQCWINNDLQRQGILENFHWLGYTENPGYICGGADVYLLTSREDPFPSTALEAMQQYTPVIAFQNAGGIPEVLEKNRGIVVPYGNCDKCANAIFELLKDKENYREIVENAKAYVNMLTPENYIKNILKLLVNEDIDYKKLSEKKVSVIIPNYNYETYIGERLDSILNQTIRPYEIIFLDDVSSDNSVSVAREILESSGIKHTIIVNESNNGCFRQWLKGIQHAEGDIIWIAEADDLCESSFLEKLLPFFEDDQVNLAYAQSEVIYEHGEHSGYVYTEYTKDLDENKWYADYINHGENEIIDGLGIKNTIPNASGVLFRKSALEGLENELKNYSISGDWYAYVYAVRIGKIAFYSGVLNYHRRHSTSIIHKREQDIKLFIELMNIKLFIAENFLIPKSIYDRFINHIKREYTRLMPDTALPFEQQQELVDLQNRLETIVKEKIQKYVYLQNIPPKKILYVIPDFEMGGGQTLVIRLANYFSKFHQVYLYNARPWLREERIVKMISSKVTVLDSNGSAEQLRGYVLSYKIDIINDHIWWSDKIVYNAVNDLDTKIVLSMHGCYEALMEHPDWDGDFEQLSPKILKRADEIIYATVKNKKIFEKVPVLEKAHQIYYGYELESIPKKNKKDFGIEEDAFVFGLVARGIKEKGFGEAAEAFVRMKDSVNKNIHLVLIGNGEFIDQLKQQYKEYSKIHFIDNLKKPSEWIGWVKNFDAAMLPTYFISESLPNSVIEYLAYDVPVITTDIGDIRHMIINGTEEAGIVLKLKNGIVDIDELAQAMTKIVVDKELYNKYKKGTKVLFSQFDIKNFANNYYSLYN